jgi:hypothetical protein
MRLFKVKLIGNDAPLYLKGYTLTDALEGAGHGRDVFDVLETASEIDPDKEASHGMLQNYVQLNGMLECNGSNPITLANATSLGLNENTTEDEMVKMAQMVLHERMVQGRLESDYDWDDDDWDDDDWDDDDWDDDEDDEDDEY